MKIFLSWSGQLSNLCAEQVRIFLKDCFYNKIDVFMSSKDIELGSLGIPKILDTLYESDCCIVCLTPMNVNAPWISFEAGMIAGNKTSNPPDNNYAKVYPLLFGNINQDTISNHPLRIFQNSLYNNESIMRIYESIAKRLSVNNSFEDLKNIEGKIKKLTHEIHNILGKCPGLGSLTYNGLLENLEKKMEFQSHAKGDVALFDKNFETPVLYSEILEYVDKRLYIFGRKNTKLFSNTNRNFFKDLPRKIDNGFDFKCLFIDPRSSNLKKSQATSNMTLRLTDRISTAFELLDSEILFEKVCRFYPEVREIAIIVADDVVIYAPILFNEAGQPDPLTGAFFFITSIDSEIGHKHLNIFNNVWKNAASLKYDDIIDKIL